MSSEKKTTKIGVHVAEVQPSTPTKPSLILNSSSPFDTPLSIQMQTLSGPPTPSNEEYDPTSTHPFSAFYSHPTTRTSFEQLKSTSRTAIISEKDLENGLYNPSTNDLSREHALPSTSSSVPSSMYKAPTSNHNTKPCTVWPGPKQLMQRSREMQRARVCHPLRNLTQKQRLWAKILIALIIIGAAVAIGVGISKAVGGGVWKNNNEQTPIGS
ncbi:hypothetical protein MMC25_000089 [Agyrium rufum]|nr:hypothetical protein [Agyrium rufum]